MARYCGVVGCNTSDATERNVFFMIPAIRKHHEVISRSRRSKWLTVLKIDDLTESKRKHFWICSRHFISGRPANWTDFCNPDWVPSKNLGEEIADVSVIDKKCELNFNKSDTIRGIKKNGTFTDSSSDSVTVPFEHFKVKSTVIPKNFPAPRRSRCSEEKNIEENKKNFRCNNCGKRFSSTYYYAHVSECKSRKMRNETEEKSCFTCNICQRTFHLRIALKRHITSHLHDGKKSMCDICRKVFPGKTVPDHVCAPPTKAVFSCDECHSVLFSEANMEIHKYKSHIRQKTIVCITCKKNFSINFTAS